jgi:hypothetical protein
MHTNRGLDKGIPLSFSSFMSPRRGFVYIIAVHAGFTLPVHITGVHTPVYNISPRPGLIHATPSGWHIIARCVNAGLRYGNAGMSTGRGL